MINRFLIASLLVLSSMTSVGHSQFIAIEEATTTSIDQVITTVIVEINGTENSRKQIPGKPQEPRVSKAKVVSKGLGLAGYGPPLIEFENVDGSDAQDAFVESGDSWILRKEGKFRVIATAMHRETFVLKKQKEWIEQGPPVPGSDAVVARGLKVLVVYESEEASSQRWLTNIIGSPIITNYVRKRSSDASGNPNIRFLDQHTKYEVCDTVWCPLLARKRKEVPWLIIANDKSMYEGPVPSDVQSFLNLLKKYGGQ